MESRCNREDSLTGRVPEMIPNHQEITREDTIRRSELPEMKPVVSSNIHSIGYDAANKLMYVLFAKDAPCVYRYPQVDEERYRFVINAESVGKAFASSVKARSKDDPSLYYDKLKLVGDGVAVTESSP